MTLLMYNILSIDYSDTIHGIRYGKYINNELHILFEIIGKLETLKINNLGLSQDKVRYFVYKDRAVTYEGGMTVLEYIWL